MFNGLRVATRTTRSRSRSEVEGKLAYSNFAHVAVEMEAQQKEFPRFWLPISKKELAVLMLQI
jgi:hypothetical protein